MPIHGESRKTGGSTMPALRRQRVRSTFSRAPPADLVSVSHGQKVQQSAPDHSSSILARTVESPTQHW